MAKNRNQNNKTQKSKIILHLVLITFITVIIVLIIRLRKKEPISIQIPFVALCLLALLIFINIILCIIMKIKHPNTAARRNKVLEQKEELENNYRKFLSKIKRATFICKCYLWLFFLLIFTLYISVASFLFDSIFETTDDTNLIAGLVCLLIILVFLAIFLYRLFSENDDELPPHIFLSPQEFPFIYEMVLTAMKKLAIYTPVNILIIPGCNIGIKQKTDCFELVIGNETLRLLSEAELSSIFLHEFGHARAKDTEHSKERGTFVNRWNSLSKKRGLFPFFLFVYLAGWITEVYVTYEFLMSYRLEIEADKSAAMYSDKQDLINALAKTNFWMIFQYELSKLNILSYESIPSDYYEIHFKNFLEEYANRKDKWDFICINQLPAKIDTHPNLAERMNNLNVKEYSVDFISSEGKLMEECGKIESIIVDAIKNSWAEERKYFYEEPKNVIALYESGEASISDSEAAHAYFALREYDKSLELCETILKDNSKNLEAMYCKALIFCDRYNNSGIDIFVKLLDDYNYCDRAYLRLGQYMQFLGLKDEREKFRPIMYSKIDMKVDIAISGFKGLEKSTLSLTTVEKLSKYLKSADILSAYLFTKKISKNRRDSLCIFFAGISEERKQYLMNKLFIFLSESRISVDVYAFDNSPQSKTVFKVLKSKHIFRVA